ncbi:MAG TPA: hypothetical protein VG944_07060 [Fimbriimonas sp.]|nr:hypothetical protein [Fimbriimonas sp.]
MLHLLLDLDPPTFFNGDNGSPALILKIVLAFLVGIGLIFALMAAPLRLRRFIVVAVTFLSGLYYFLLWFFPAPISRGPTDAPNGPLESFSFLIADAVPSVVNVSNILSAVLIGLGIYSLLRIHLGRIVKQQKDWAFSLVLVVSLFTVAFFGYWDWIIRQGPTGGSLGAVPNDKWSFPLYAKDFFFEGFLQQMDSAMFSLIAFYILSAAYRAFRARSVEATILLLSALIVILASMGLIQSNWDNTIDATHIGFLKNIRLEDMRTWLNGTMQAASIRGLDFGVGVGLLAMALRLWLSLEPLGRES